jgi:hypothetical protein
MPVEFTGGVTESVRDLVVAAERAGAASAFVDAGLTAASHELWRVAIRCYRAALEIDLLDREVVARLLGLGKRAGEEWAGYARSLDRADWRPFGCIGATIVSADSETSVHCPDVGAVLDIQMSDHDRIDAHAMPRFADMPLAMALIIVRRAIWPKPRSLWPGLRDRPPARVRVKWPAYREVWLDELGDWKAL